MADRGFGHPVEILAIGKGRCTEPGRYEGIPMALLTLRLHPEEDSREVLSLMFSPEQCVRLRDTMDQFLCDPASWLHVAWEEQQAMNLDRGESCL